MAGGDRAEPPSSGLRAQEWARSPVSARGGPAVQVPPCFAVRVVPKTRRVSSPVGGTPGDPQVGLVVIAAYHARVVVW